MSTAVQESLPSAIAIVISAAPILALVLLMVTSRPISVSAMFLVGWAAGIVTVATFLSILVDTSAPTNPSGGMSIPGAVIRIVLGVTLGILAIRAWRQRASSGTPKWMSGVTGWSSARSLTAGYLLGSINPKNLALVAVGTTSILEATAVPREQALSIVVFAAVASLGVATPVVLRAFGGAGVHRGLERGADWMKANGKTISVFVLGLISAVLILKGLGGLRYG